MGLVGVGIDLVDIKVFKERLDSKMIEDLFLPGEMEYCTSRARPWESYAARFAAKEAVFKALGRGLSHGMGWKDVEVVRDHRGAVYVLLGGNAARAAEELSVKSIWLSLSHTRTSAIAMVTIQDDGEIHDWRRPLE